ncbi:MAG: peptide-binding protein [Deltaproteobacteria bacterium]
MIRRRAAAVAFLLLGCVAAGCRQRMPLDEGTLVIALPGAPDTIDPRLAADAYGTQILQMTHASLIRLDAAGEPVPDLAESWEQESPTAYRFRLRDGVRFHDGRELTSVDVRDTFEWILDPKHRSPHRHAYSAISRIETPDPRTIVFRLKEPFAPFLAGMVRGIVPRGSPVSAYSPPVGAGPYRIEDYRQGEAVTLSRFEGYFGGAPAIERVEVKFVPDTNVRFLELRKGSVNFVLNGVDPDLLPAALENRNLVMEEAPGSNASYLGFNLRDPILSDRRVRRAIALAIDREAIVKAIWGGHADVADSILAPGYWAHAEGLPPLRHDPRAAAALLDAAGRPDPDGAGPKPRFRLTYKTSQNELRRRIAAVFQEQLRAVGIDLEIHSYEWGTFFSDIRNGNFQLYSLTWVGIRDPDIYHYVFHSGSAPPAGANRGGYQNPAVDRLVEAGRRETSRSARKAIYGKVQRILWEDLPIFPLWIHRNILVRDRRLAGFVITPDEDYGSVRRMRIEPDPSRPAEK